jgi:hypothetical protein
VTSEPLLAGKLRRKLPQLIERQIAEPPRHLKAH